MFNFILLVTKINDKLAEKRGNIIRKWIKNKYSLIKILDEKDILKDNTKLNKINLIITIGGDGTLLFVNSLFNDLKISIPPVLPFFSGSLGFIQSYDFKDWKDILLKVFNKNYNLLLKNRIIGSYQNKYFNALNEIIVQRGRSPKILEFDILIDGNNITTIKADGIIISTSTGSTGYNLSAGGVLVHPSIDVILLTPICPFSLTFRPLILNSDANIKINLINGEACIQSDGKEIDQIKQGNILDIIKCDDPFKIINFDDNDKWYLNIKKKLNWGS